MRVIRTARLGYREGNSDKVYEVDLCEVGPGKFVVNFRYGRRGTNLREGSKTPIPVSQAQAEAAFEALVRSKTSSGYRDATAPSPDVSRPTGPGWEPGASDPAGRRAEAILARLRSDSRFRTRWRPSRVAWAAGMLRLSEAEPPLLALLSSPPKTGVKGWWRRRRSSRGASKEGKQGEVALSYSVAWALGRCGSSRSVTALRGLVAGHPSPDVRRIALESLRLVLPPEGRAGLLAEALGRLPAGLAKAARVGPPEAVVDALKAAIDERAGDRADAFLHRLPDLAQKPWHSAGKTKEQFVREAMESPKARAALSRLVDLDFEGGRDPIDELYLIDDERTRPAVIEALRSAPLASNRFRAIRHAFKSAEHRGDAEVFAVLAHRFETTPAGPRIVAWQGKVVIPEVYPFQLKLDDGAPGLVTNAYSAATRHYLRRRAWRTLAALGEAGRPDYVAMASAVLLEFSDDDAKATRSNETHRYDRGWRHPPTVRRTWFDRFADYHILNHILYANSPRYRPTRRLNFSCDAGYEPGGPAPDRREEAFPHLWDAAPEALVRLLLESRCGPVHEFAARALRANRPACDGLGLDVVKRLATSDYDPTARLGVDLAIGRFDPSAPDPELVLILADSRIDAAREQARSWARDHWGTLARVPELVVGLATSRFADTRSFARDRLRETAFPDAEGRALVARFVAAILAMGEGDEDRAGDAAEAMLSAFRPVLRTIGEGVIRDLLAHPLPQARRLAGELIVGHDVFATNPPADIVSALFASPHAEVRAVGVRILDGMGDEVLIYHPEVILALVRHPLGDVRDNIRPTVRRLAAADPAFGRHLGERLVDLLLVPGAPEGVPGHTARVLRDDLREYLNQIPPEAVLRLLRSRSLPAQEVGGLLLPTNVDTAGLPLDELVRLASCDVLSVREAAWSVFRGQPDRIRADLMTAARLADAKWEDSRRFAFALLRDEIGPVDWPVDALVTLCDSVKPDVQRLGRELIARASRAEDGETLALKLGEHPDPAMQEFAGLFLEQFAPGNPETVDRLRFFCTAVLSLVNRGRVAKERVFAFLERVALADEASARVVAEVLARQSAGAEVSYRSRALALMVRIHEAFPGVEQPIRVREPEIRHAL